MYDSYLHQIPINRYFLPEYSLKISCDDAEELYVDGVKQTLAHSATWNTASHVRIPPGNKRLIAVLCKNADLEGGLIVQMDLLEGRKLSTDKSWLCSTKLVNNWFLPTIQVSAADWKPAAELARAHDLGGEFDSDVKWIWSEETGKTAHTIYCRKFVDLPGVTC